MIQFREEALRAHTSPDQLDQPLPLLRPSLWAMLLGLLLLLAAILIWSVLGRLPVRIQGRGVLLLPEALMPVQSPSAGPLLRILVGEGQCVRAGQPMARIDLVQLRVAMEAGRNRLQQLRRQHSLAGLQAQRERALAEEDLQRLLPYRGSGAIAEETFIDKERQLQRIDGQQLAEAQQRMQGINDELLALGRQQQEYERNSLVVSPVAGCVVEQLVQPGAVLNAGTALFSLERRDRPRELVSLAYFPSQDGKRLKPGQTVRITPTTTRAQRHGGIRGRILSLRALPVSREGLRQRLGLDSLVATVQPPGSDGNQPLIEAVTSLQRDPRTRSGFDWGGGPGPNLSLSPGTGTEVSVLVEYRQPISYVIPLLRDISGIY
ncbi:MAG: HlyD family efflux transporter periplasmic adaptor subunit [Cyanobacteriota bacterium]|nr:HlyD family efflux transporter periplasmic adaptor subunit [Cyanobacteriota bacterium]